MLVAEPSRPLSREVQQKIQIRQQRKKNSRGNGSGGKRQEPRSRNEYCKKNSHTHIKRHASIIPFRSAFRA